jgi:type II secretory pathway component PulF
MNAQWRGRRVGQKHLAIFYRSLSQMLYGGMPIARALDTLARSAGTRGLRRVVSAMRDHVERGGTISEAMLAMPRTFSRWHAELVGVAERSGRTEATLIELAEFTERLIEIRNTVLTGLLLPGAMLHAAAFIVPFPALFLGGSREAYLQASVGFLAIIWGIAVGGVVAVRICLRSPAGSAVLDAIIRPIPIFGRSWRELDYWRVSSGMGMLIDAGLGVVESLRQCARFCRSPRIARALCRTADAAERGVPPSETLQASGAFPGEMVGLWATGEQSGKLDETFAHLSKMFAERCQRRMQEVARWVPRIMYGAVMIYMVIQIFELAGRYISALESF